MAVALAELLWLTATTSRGAFPNFKEQELAEKITVGYGVLLLDVNGDGKPDIVVADSKRVIWFENPSWTMHVILQGQTAPDNVAIAPIDIRGNGKICLVLGAGWKGYNTRDNSTLQWLEPGEDVKEPWTMHSIPFDQVALHRVHTGMVNRQPRIVVAPLLGRGASAAGNYSESTPGLLEYSIPKDPVKGPWKPEVITDKLHVTHNFTFVDFDGRQQSSILLASYEGIWHLSPGEHNSWQAVQVAAGEQSNPKASRGSSEVKLGHAKDGSQFIAAIEPWHGNEVVVYTPPGAGQGGNGLWDRKVIDSSLKEGHGLWTADLDSSGGDSIIACSRAGTAGNGRGVFAYTPGPGGSWEKHVIDDKSMAGEDLAAMDLNGDGKIDIVAVGRATHNIRIYWNQGSEK